ncbi:MAG: adenosylcobinamide-phosphate synthase CbiB [Oscillospiraceae bacterium]|nr:adenosylcobinamide-phosphate synthase CbiB [Oscillospiraceae bacterium]
MLLYSTAAMIAGFSLDLIIGDPQRFPHIVRLMGLTISKLERLLQHIFPKTPRGEILGGVILAVVVVVLFTGPVFIALFFAYRFSPWLGFSIETLFIYQCLAIKSLRVESMKVFHALKSGNILLARKNLSMIVGRDTENLDEQGIARAAVETVAESTADGVIAPMFYIMLGGAAFGILLKAVSTMDSMVGYKNERYLYFGRAGARFDDVFGYIPARLAAYMMIVSAKLTGLNARGAARIWRRDRKNHASPNSGHTEAACSGALGIRLAGPAIYSGELREKPYIGDDTRQIVPDDIKKATRLTYAAAALMLMFAIIVRGVVYAIL